jgi:hypothetical protein
MADAVTLTAVTVASLEIITAIRRSVGSGRDGKGGVLAGSQSGPEWKNIRAFLFRFFRLGERGLREALVEVPRHLFIVFP